MIYQGDNIMPAKGTGGKHLLPKKKKAKKVLKDEKGTFEWELTGPRHRSI